MLCGVFVQALCWQDQKKYSPNRVVINYFNILQIEKIRYKDKNLYRNCNIPSHAKGALKARL